MLRLLKVFLLYIVILAVRIFDLISDKLFGWTFAYGRQQERQLAKNNFANSAQVVSIVAKICHQPGHGIINVNSCYLLKHVRYTDPRKILEDDSICLSHLTADSAVFAVPRKGEDFFDTKKSPFLCYATYDLADTYIIVPLQAFHKLADEAGDPRPLLCMVAPTLRCGSTLIMQALNNVPDTRTLSEANAFSSITQLYVRKDINDDEAKRILRSTIRMLARTGIGSNIKRVVFKVEDSTIPWLDVIKELFPNMKMIKNTRHPINSILSLKKVGTTMYEGLLGKLGSNWRNWSGPAFVLGLDRYSGSSKPARLIAWWWWGLVSIDEICILYYVCTLAGVQRFDHVFDAVVLFEDLVGDREMAIRKILKVLKIDDEKIVNKALKAYEQDSQNGIFNMKTSRKLTKGMRESTNYWIKVAKLPIDVDCSMETFREYVNA